MKHRPNKKRVIAWLQKWTPFLFLNGWRIEYRFSDIPDGDTLASARVKYEYKDSIITIYPDFWTLPLEEQERVLIHELSHSITAHLADLVERQRAGYMVTENEQTDVEEALVQTITNIIWGLHTV